MPTLLSPNFTLEELTFSQTAARQGIINTPDAQQIEALRELCTKVLQPLRDALGLPITVSSGFRCPELNRAVQGAADSQHLLGQAADLQCFSLAPAEFFRRAVAMSLPFDQLIYEGSPHTVWVHISYSPAARGEILRATFPPAGGVAYNGLTRDQAATLVA
jgi:zinc D-Ala-D-Ala carboxypeptidase